MSNKSDIYWYSQSELQSSLTFIFCVSVISLPHTEWMMQDKNSMNHALDSIRFNKQVFLQRERHIYRRRRLVWGGKIKEESSERGERFAWKLLITQIFYKWLPFIKHSRFIQSNLKRDSVKNMGYSFCGNFLYYDGFLSFST